MTEATLEARDRYVAEFGRAGKSLPGPAEPRRKAISRFAEIGFPTGREEDWRFTDVTPLVEVPFKPAAGTANPNQFSGLARGPLRACQIAFVDGRFAPAFSTLELPQGVTVRSLREAADDYFLRYPYKAYPVVDGGRFVGVLTLRALQDEDRGRWGELRAGDVVSRGGPPHVVHPRELVLNAMRKLAESGQSRLAVVEGGQLVGLLCGRDVLDLMEIRAGLSAPRDGRPW